MLCMTVLKPWIVSSIVLVFVLGCRGDDCLLAVECVCTHLYMDHVIKVITEMCCIVVGVFILGCVISHVGFVCFTGLIYWSSIFVGL